MSFINTLLAEIVLSFLARDLNNKEVPINDYVREMLTVYGDKIENVANFLNKDVVLAQKGNLILANSGSKTSVTDLSKIEKGEDLINGIINNLKINA